ncbi:MAG: hypothetical protein ACWGQW_06705, partial [bacterium]
METNDLSGSTFMSLPGMNLNDRSLIVIRMSHHVVCQGTISHLPWAESEFLSRFQASSVHDACCSTFLAWTKIHTVDPPVIRIIPPLHLEAIINAGTFRYSNDGNLTIDFNVYYLGAASLTADLRFSETPTQGTGRIIATNVPLNTDTCDDADFTT